MKHRLLYTFVLITILLSIFTDAFCENKLEKIGTMKTVLGQLTIYAIWTEDLVDPQAAAGLVVGDNNTIIFVRREFIDPLVDGINKALKKVAPVHTGPKLTEEERFIAKVPVKFSKNYEAEIKFIPRTKVDSEGVVVVNFMHEGSYDSKDTVCLMMYPKQATVMITAMQKALDKAEANAAKSTTL